MFTYEELKMIEEYFEEPENQNKLRLEVLYALVDSEREIVFRFNYKSYAILLTFDNEEDKFIDNNKYEVHVGEKSKFIPALNILITKVKEYIDKKEEKRNSWQLSASFGILYLRRWLRMTQVITLEEAKRIKEEFENGTLPLIDESISDIDVLFNDFISFIGTHDNRHYSIIYNIDMNVFEHGFDISLVGARLPNKEITSREQFIPTLKDIIDSQKEEAYD